MVKRPQISDELVEFVEERHEEVTGTQAGSFEQALQTFHRLHHASDATIGRGVDHHTATDVQASLMGTHPQTTVSPDEQAVFKTRLDGGDLHVPEEELTALGLEDGQLVQVVAYPIGTDGATREGDE